MKTSWTKFEKWLPLFFALVFVFLTASNLDTMQNPDELVHRVNRALEGRWAFDETNFDYPSLPKYVMFGVGKLVYGFGFGEAEFYVVARFISVLLGAATIYLVYHLTRRAGGGVWASVLASIFLLSNHILSINARFAHNDLYMLFFITLSAYFLLRYVEKMERGWLYTSFFSVGLTASSKYNGGIFLLVPLVVWVGYEYRSFWAAKLRTLETLFISAVLTFGGFALGTPKALLWMVFYFKRMLPALARHASYGANAGGARGVVGQWAQLADLFGIAVFILVLIVVFYFVYGFFTDKTVLSKKKPIWIFLLAILVYDLPIMASYNYQARFFLPLLPFFAVLFGLFIEEMIARVGQGKFVRYQVWVAGVAVTILLVGFLRVISVRLLLANDARIPASEMIDTLPADLSIEYTFYTPDFDRKRFEREHDYPVFFIKHEGDVVPDEIDKGYPSNRGEAGLIERDTDYFVVDDFTYGRCENGGVYATNPVECVFFAELLAGETSYEMIAEFTYTLPNFLPQVEIAFVNPEIRVFQKRE